MTLVVQAGGQDFTLAAAPASRTILKGGSTTYSVTITPVNGFAGSVTLSVSGLPNRSAGSFSPSPATSSSTLTVTTKNQVKRGTFTLTVKGTSGSLSHTTPVTLVIR